MDGPSITTSMTDPHKKPSGQGKSKPKASPSPILPGPSGRGNTRGSEEGADPSGKGNPRAVRDQEGSIGRGNPRTSDRTGTSGRGKALHHANPSRRSTTLAGGSGWGIPSNKCTTPTPNPNGKAVVGPASRLPNDNASRKRTSSQLCSLMDLDASHFDRFEGSLV